MEGGDPDNWGSAFKRVSVHVQDEINEFIDSLMNPVTPTEEPDHSFFAQIGDPPPSSSSSSSFFFPSAPPPPPPMPPRPGQQPQQAQQAQQQTPATPPAYRNGGTGTGTNWMSEDFWEEDDTEMDEIATPQPFTTTTTTATTPNVMIDPSVYDYNTPTAPSYTQAPNPYDEDTGGGITATATIMGIDNDGLDALFDEILQTPTAPGGADGGDIENSVAMGGGGDDGFIPVDIYGGVFGDDGGPSGGDPYNGLSETNMVAVRALTVSAGRGAGGAGGGGGGGSIQDTRRPVPRGRGKGAPRLNIKHDQSKFQSVRQKLRPPVLHSNGGTRRRNNNNNTNNNNNNNHNQGGDTGSAESSKNNNRDDVEDDYSIKKVGKAKKRKGGAHWPIWTVLVALADIAMMILVLVENGGFEPFSTNPWGGPSKHILLKYGAKYSPYIRDCQGQCYYSVYYDHCGGDWWRLISAVFLHAGLGHLLLNLLILLRIGWTLERQYGTLRVAPIFLLSGIAGNIASGIMLPFVVTVASSAALFGFIGVLLADLIHNWAIIMSPIRNLIFILIGVLVALALGFLPGIDNFANAAGLIEGVLAGLIFLPSIAGRTRKCHQGLRWTLVAIMVPLNIVFFGMLLMVFYVCVQCKDCKIVTCIPVLDFCTYK